MANLEEVIGVLTEVQNLEPENKTATGSVKYLVIIFPFIVKYAVVIIDNIYTINRLKSKDY